MREIKKALSLTKLEYFRTHLSFINCVLPKKLTPMEINVLGSFMSLSGDIGKDRFGTSARKIVRGELNLKPAGLSNYLRDLKKSGFLKEVNGDITILPILFPNEKEQFYQFKITNVG